MEPINVDESHDSVSIMPFTMIPVSGTGDIAAVDQAMESGEVLAR